MKNTNKKPDSILLTVNSKRYSIKLYPAELWENKCNVAIEPDLFRVRVNRRWVCLEHKYTFFTRAQVVARLYELLEETPPALPALPKLLPRQKVSVAFGLCLYGQPLRSTQGMVLAPPHLGADGRAWVWVTTFENGPQLALCDCITPYPVRS